MSENVSKIEDAFLKLWFGYFSLPDAARLSSGLLLGGLLFLYLEVLAMVRVFWESQSIQITLPLFIAITALARFIILQGKNINPEVLLYEAGAIVLIAIAILVLRFRNSSIVGLEKKKKISKK